MSPYRGGDERVRTDDPLLAKQVLSQLSYTPAFSRFGCRCPLCLKVCISARPSKLNNTETCGTLNVMENHEKQFQSREIGKQVIHTGRKRLCLSEVDLTLYE